MCEVNNKGYCKGCLRSRDERLYWLQLSPAQRREVVRLCHQRKARIQKAREAALQTSSAHEQDTQQGSLF